MMFVKFHKTALIFLVKSHLSEFIHIILVKFHKYRPTVSVPDQTSFVQVSTIVSSANNIRTDVPLAPMEPTCL